MRRPRSPPYEGSLRPCLAPSIAPRRRRVIVKQVPRKRALFAKFFADRGTHLAAMIAYFALLAFVPLTFLALSLLAFTGQATESSFLVREIKQALPETPIEDIVRLVRTVQDNAGALGLVGAAFLLWTALSLFS